jgi:hypothetical protein
LLVFDTRNHVSDENNPRASSDCCWCLTHAITSVMKTTHVQVAMVFEQRNKNMAAVVVEVMDCLNMIREGMGEALT